MPIKIIKKPKPLKLKKAIATPHHFTVKVTRERKIELKILATKRRETIIGMFGAALTAFLAAPPAEFAHLPAPQPTDRFVFKVEPELAQAVHALVEELGVPAQAIITAAIDRYTSKPAP
jgi:predicted transcriptional regulator